MTHEDVFALAPEYVLGHLDDVTRARVAAHLAGCPTCVEEVRSVAQAFDGIGRSVPEVAPPDALRERILRIPSTVTQVTASVPVRPATTRPPSPAVPWFAAAAASLLAAVAIWQAVGARSEIERLQLELAQMQQLAGQSQVTRVALERQVDEFAKQTRVLRASDMVSYALAGSAGMETARARAYVTQKNGVVFTAEGLPALPAGKIYQLWVIVGAKAISVGLISPDADGRAQAVLATPEIDAMPGVVAVTLEPAGGLPQPSTAPILVGKALQQ